MNAGLDTELTTNGRKDTRHRVAQRTELFHFSTFLLFHFSTFPLFYFLLGRRPRAMNRIVIGPWRAARLPAFVEAKIRGHAWRDVGTAGLRGGGNRITLPFRGIVEVAELRQRHRHRFRQPDGLLHLQQLTYHLHGPRAIAPA